MKRKEKIYISLTTIRTRVDRVEETVASILNQRRSFDSLRLYLSKEPWLLDEGVPEACLPPRLRRWRDEGRVEIRYTQNIGPYRKLLPLLRELRGQGSVVIVTADDDTVYPPDWLEGLMATHARYPHDVIAWRCRQMSLRGGELTSYFEWPLVETIPSPYDPRLLFATGKDGVLYEPRMFDDVVFEDGFLELCPFNDDIWFKFAALLKGTGVRVVERPRERSGFPETTDSKAPKLHRMNLDRAGAMNNDGQIRKVLVWLQATRGWSTRDLSSTPPKPSASPSSTRSRGKA